MASKTVIRMKRITKQLASIEQMAIWSGPFLIALALAAVAELQASGSSCTDPACLLLALINPRMGLYLAVALMVTGVLVYLCTDFVRAIYGLHSRGAGAGFLERQLFGVSSFKPFLIVKEGKLPAASKDPLVRIGGPGTLIIYNDSAVVLEKAGRLTRVEKKGYITLTGFEKVWDVIDLRPQRWVYDVDAVTKEGIPVKCQADVTFQIDDGGQAPKEDEPYPADARAIFVAATSKWMREASRSEDEQTFDWARRAIIGITEGKLRNILATYMLDQILGPDELNQKHYRAEILSKLEAELHQPFADLGAKVTKVELGDITVSDAIAQQRIDAWQSLWKRWMKEREAEGEAEQLLYVEAAKAQAQADMIVAITQAFRSLTEAGVMIPSQFVLLRMFEVLKRASFDPQTGMLFLPTEIMNAWKLVQGIAQDEHSLMGGSKDKKTGDY
jgi:regulator of protease activity HflC (stomatin/prohibitin superfamily)